MSKPIFKIIIAGFRGFKDYKFLKEKLDFFLERKAKTHKIIIISGTAKGADKLGEKYAKEKGYEIERFPANWDEHGKKAGYIRNSEMADHAHALVAFWDGISKGTKHMIDLAERKELFIRIIYYKGECI